MATNEEITSSLTESIDALREHDFSESCSGYRQEVYLDPEDHTVSVFSCVGSGWPMRAHHNIDVHVISVPGDAVADSVADAIATHVDLLASVCESFRGTRWDGSNHVGDWDEPDDVEDPCGTPRMALGYTDWPEISCAWDAGDWLSHCGEDWGDWCRSAGVDPERGDEVVAEVAEHLQGLAAGDGHALKDPADYLAGCCQEWAAEHAD